MPWLAWLLPCIDPAPGVPPDAQGWWALRFTPCVTLLDEALLLEVDSVERLWGGRAALQALLRNQAPAAAQENAADQAWATGPTALQALALLRLQRMGRSPPQRLPHDLPIATLTALRPHVAALQHLGCRSWAICARCRVPAWRGALAVPACWRWIRPGATPRMASPGSPCPNGLRWSWSCRPWSNRPRLC